MYLEVRDRQHCSTESFPESQESGSLTVTPQEDKKCVSEGNLHTQIQLLISDG